MFDIRLVAYEPFGERLGELPSPLHIEAGDPLSDMPSMRVKYSTSSAGSPLLNREVEVALEAYNPRAGAWFEPPNCRFVNVRSEGDSLDQADGISYTLPGYSWLLSRIQVFPLSASFVNGQVSDATKSEKTARDALNASQDALLRAMNKPKGATVEIDSLQPSNQKAVWVDMTKPEAPVVKVYQNNQWVKAAASVQDEGKRAGALWVQHQQTQGQLRDVQDRSRLTKRTFNGRHAGSIFAELLEEARTRGNRLSGMQATFTKTHDSAGKPWPANPGVIQVNTGSDMGALLTTFVEGGQLDFRTNGRKLDVYIQDTELSRDASDSAVLRYGYHIDEAPDKSTIEGLAGSMLFIGDDGLIFSRDNPQAAQPWGVWESSVSQSGVKSEGVGERYARSALQEAAQRRVERTRGLVFHEGVTAPLPYVDYRPGDFVAAPGSSGSNEKQRVQQITLTKDGKTGQVAGNIVLNDRFLEREIKNSRSLKAVMGGGSIGGTGGSRDQETYVDLRSPVPPRYVKGEAVGNYVKNLGIQAYMDVDWYWEAKATNGTAMTDALTSFQVRYRLVQEGTSGTGAANSMAWVAAPDAPGDEHQTTIGPIEGWNRRTNAPAVYEVIVRACANNGKVSEWSKVGTIQVLTDNESPIAPSRPGARAEGSVLWVEWDGKMSSGGKPPADFLSIKVHEARVPDDAPRDEDTQAVDDGYLNALSYTLVDSTPLTEAGAAPVFDRKYGEQYAYKLTAVDFFGNESEKSAPSQPVHTVPLVDDTFLQEQLEYARQESERQQAELDKKLEEANAAIGASAERLDGIVESVTHAEEAALASDKKATDALNKAGEARASVDGKTTITRALEPRTTQPGTAVGDTHFTMSSMGGGGQVLRQQRWDGSTWQDESLSHQVIASLDLGKATVGELDGGRIKAGTILSDRVVVSVGENLIPDPTFLNEAMNASRTTDTAWRIGTAASGAKVLTTNSTTQSDVPLTGAPDGWMQVDSAAKYQLQMLAAGPDQLSAYLMLLFADGSIRADGFQWVRPLTGTLTPKIVEWDMAALGGPVAVRPMIRRNPTPSGASNYWQQIGAVSFRRKVGTVLIEDGAVTGDKVNAQSVAAATGKFLSLDVGQLTTTGTANINEAVVNNLWAKKIATKKIVASEVIIGQGGNLIPNGFGEMNDLTGFSQFNIQNDSAPLNSAIGATATFWTDKKSGVPSDDYTPVVAGSNYAWKISSRGKYTGQKFYFQVRWYDANNEAVTSKPSDYLVTNQTVEVSSWSTFTGIVQAPAGAAYARFTFYCNHQNGTQNENQWHRIGGFDFRDAVAGRLIVDGSISTQHVNAETFDVTKLLKANSIEAQYLKVDQIKDAVRIDSDIFNGRLYKGAIFQGGEFRTHDSRDKGIAIFAAGMRVTDPRTGKRTFDINASTGEVNITGTFVTGAKGDPSVRVVSAESSWNGVDQGVWFTYDGNPYGVGTNTNGNFSVAGVYTTAKPGSWSMTPNVPLQLRGYASGGVKVWDALQVQNYLGGNSNIVGDGALTISSDSHLRIMTGDRTYIGKGRGRGSGTICFGYGDGYGWETGAAANVRMTTDGQIWMVTSKRANKLDIQPYEVDESILELPVRDWVDRVAHEEFQRLLDEQPRPMDYQDQSYYNELEVAARTRSIGVIAEEALETGARDLVEYDNEGEVVGFAYPKLAVLHQPFLKELWEFKKKYEPMVEELETLLPKLRELVS